MSAKQLGRDPNPDGGELHENQPLRNKGGENVSPQHSQNSYLENKFPTRYIIGITALFCSALTFFVRSAFSLSLLAMANARDENGTLIEQPNYGPRYDYSAYDQGLLLGAFYYAYPVSSLPVGLLIDRFEIGRICIAAGFILSALMCVLSPLAAAAGTIWWLFATRIVVGVSQGGNFVNVHRLFSRWAPRSELGRFAFAISGANFGTIATWMISGPIIERFGWQWSFYVTAALVVVFVAVWLYVMYDSPARHPRIAEAERAFIESNLMPPAEQKWPPFGRMLRSQAFWGLLSLTFATDWGLYFIMTSGPKFLNQVLDFQISSTGFLASLPYIAKIMSASVFGHFGDKLKERKLVSLTAFRKLFSLVSHILPSLFLLGLIFLDAQQPYTCIALLVLSMVFNGATVQTNLSNYHDIAPTMAASTISIVNFVSATTGFISPLVVAYLTSERNTMEQWRYVFMTGSGVYLLGSIMFLIFGSAEDQKWSESLDQDVRGTSDSNETYEQIQAVTKTV